MVAVVERGGFLWFCNFFVGFVAFVFFLLILCFFVAYGQGRWLYGEVFAFFYIGLAFCPSVFELSSFDFVLRPFLRVPFP